MDPEGEKQKKLKRWFIAGNKIKLKYYYRKSYLAKKNIHFGTSFSSSDRSLQNRLRLRNIRNDTNETKWRILKRKNKKLFPFLCRLPAEDDGQNDITTYSCMCCVCSIEKRFFFVLVLFVPFGFFGYWVRK